MESAVLHSPDFYNNAFSFSEACVHFYTELETNGNLDIPAMAVLAM